MVSDQNFHRNVPFGSKRGLHRQQRRFHGRVRRWPSLCQPHHAIEFWIGDFLSHNCRQLWSIISFGCGNQPFQPIFVPIEQFSKHVFKFVFSIDLS